MQQPITKPTQAARSLREQINTHSEQALKALFGLLSRLRRGNEVARNNYALGVQHLAKGNYSDAIFRFKAVTWLEPENAAAWYGLGTAYFADGKPANAATHYRKALALKPDYEEATYMLAMARGNRAGEGELPRRMPRQLCISHFERQAGGFDAEQLERARYSGHTRLDAAVRAHAAPGRVDHVLLDLGCGTGLCAQPLASLASSITGVDHSKAMLAQAMAKTAGSRRLYHELVERDALDYLRAAEAESVDIAISGLMLSFMGEPNGLFGEVARVLRPGGLFAFTADRLEGAGELQLDTRGGRFRFSEAYLRKLAGAGGLAVVQLEPVEAYPGYLVWLAVLRK
jgi:predicted TPR repeat methyltransferase